jgi:hypothetical protein
MKINTKFSIGQKVTYRTFDKTYKKCEHCDQPIKKVHTIVKEGEIVDIRIEKDNISYGVKTSSYVALLKESELRSLLIVDK